MRRVSELLGLLIVAGLGGLPGPGKAEQSEHPPSPSRADSAASEREIEGPSVRARVDVRDGDDFLDELDGRNPFLRAIRRGDLDQARALLDGDPEVLGASGHMGRTALHVAVETGSLDAVRFLIGAGADVNGERGRGDTPLFWAPDRTIAATLLAAGADLHATDFAQREPIHWAAQFGRADVIQLLIEQGADVNLRDGSQMTPLHWAVRDIVDRRPLACVKVLLAAGADPTLRARAPLQGTLLRVEGVQAVHMIARLPNMDQRLLNGELRYAPEVPATVLSILELLLEAGVDPESETAAGESAYSMSQGETRALIEGYLSRSPR